VCLSVHHRIILWSLGGNRTQPPVMVLCIHRRLVAKFPIPRLNPPTGTDESLIPACCKSYAESKQPLLQHPPPNPHPHTPTTLLSSLPHTHSFSCLHCCCLSSPLLLMTTIARVATVTSIATRAHHRQIQRQV